MLTKKQFTVGFIVVLIIAAVVRLIGLGKLPSSPYWEEVALGYDAYSILKTGKDHHGNNLPLVAFESFGDYKPSGYFYATLPFIAVFGLKTWVVRLPSSLAGIFLVAGVIILARLLFFSDKNNKKSIWPLITGLIMAISPWAILFSRAAWEVNLATSILLWAIIFGIKTLQNKNLKFYWPHLLLLITCFYTYHGTRVTAPLIGVWFLLALFKENFNLIKTYSKKFILALVLTFIATLPMFLAMNRPEFKIRFAQTSAFSNLELIEQSNAAKQRLNNSFYAKFVYHRYWFFLKEIANNFLDHFNFNFLFISGDSNPRHSIQFVGQLYHIEIVFFLLGIIYLLTTQNYKKQTVFLNYWLLIAIFPASLTKTTPHALRILPSMPVFIMIISLGIFYLLEIINSCLKNKKIRYLLPAVLIIAYIAEFSYFAHSYTQLYPKYYANEWQYGYKQMLSELSQLEAQYPDLAVYITREQGRPAMYYWFYNQTSPELVQQANATAPKDQGEFLEFENKHFVDGLNLAKNDPAILVGSPDQIENYAQTHLDKNLQIIQTIKDINNKTIWQLAISQ